MENADTSKGHSTYSYWLRTERPKSLNSSPGKVKNLHFSISFRPDLRFILPHILGE
jgi:hypothetical protein